MDCVHPRSVRNPKTRTWMQVPCGMCISCRIAKTREWKLRLTMEQSQWKESCFVTLTYDDDHLHMTPCGHMTLWPDDMQKFVKRTRSQLHRYKMQHDPEYASDWQLHHDDPEVFPSPPLLKFFGCGEYGDDFGRPHYHLIVFGTEFGNWWIHHYDRQGNPVYTTDKLCELWPFGLATVGTVTPDSCGYVAGYVQKKIYKDPLKYFKEYGCVVWPFQRLSQGIGLSYYEDNKDRLWCNINLRPRMNGVSFTMPRYFSKKDERLKVALEIIGERQSRISLSKQFDDMDKGYDIAESMSAREAELLARSKMRRGKL